MIEAMDDYMVFNGEPVGGLLSALFGGVSAARPRINLELRAAKARRSRGTLRKLAHIDAFEQAARAKSA